MQQKTTASNTKQHTEAAGHTRQQKATISSARQQILKCILQKYYDIFRYLILCPPRQPLQSNEHGYLLSQTLVAVITQIHGVGGSFHLLSVYYNNVTVASVLKYLNICTT